jgi:hypothetical protein
MINKIKNILLLVYILFVASIIQAKNIQDKDNILIHTNLLSDLLLTPSLGVEVGINDKVTFSVDIWHLYMCFSCETTNYKGLFRYYYKERFNGKFIGIGYSKIADSHYNSDDGLDFKIGYLFKLKKHFYIGISGGVTYYFSDNAISEPLLPNTGLILAKSF